MKYHFLSMISHIVIAKFFQNVFDQYYAHFCLLNYFLQYIFLKFNCNIHFLWLKLIQNKFNQQLSCTEFKIIMPINLSCAFHFRASFFVVMQGLCLFMGCSFAKLNLKATITKFLSSCYHNDEHDAVHAANF